MNVELLQAIRDLSKERGLDEEVLFQSIEESLVSAYRREFNVKHTENIRGEINRETGEMFIVGEIEIVEEVEDELSQISIEAAKSLSDELEVGDILERRISTESMGRLAALAARNAISQKMNAAEKERIQNEFENKIGQITYGVVQRMDRRDVFVDIGRAEAVLRNREQMRTDDYQHNSRMKFLILNVEEKHGRPIIYISRSDANLVVRLFENEVPEIAEGIVEIKYIAREAGSRTKMAVASRDENVDPVGSCVGQKGLRVQAVMDELRGEKIDIVPWSSDPVEFIINAMSPAKVVRVDFYDEEGEARVVVPDHQLSLAIGREGQNVRLAAKLTGWKIDIKSESQVRELIESELIDKFTKAVESVVEGAEDGEAEQETADEDM